MGIDVGRGLDSLLDGAPGDLVEENATYGLPRILQQFGEVVTNRLPLPVGVGGKEDLPGLSSGRTQAGNDLFLIFHDFKSGLEFLFHVNGDLVLRKVADMAHGGFYLEASTEILADGFGLGGRFNNQERIGHQSSLRAL